MGARRAGSSATLILLAVTMASVPVARGGLATMSGGGMRAAARGTHREDLRGKAAAAFAPPSGAQRLVGGWTSAALYSASHLSLGQITQGVCRRGAGAASSSAATSIMKAIMSERGGVRSVFGSVCSPVWHGGISSPLITAAARWQRTTTCPKGTMAGAVTTTSTRMSSTDATQKGYDGEQLRLLDADECILVNDSDEVVGSASKKFCHLMANIDADKALHRAFSVFLFTEAGELVLQKRSSDKILFPDRWTNTCCSHPLSVPDELDDPPCPEASGVKRAAVRKLEHELGIPIGQVPADVMHFMTRIVYKAAVGEDDTWGEHEVDYILIGQRDADLDKLNPNEVSEVRLLKRGELEELIAAEDRGEVMLSPWFRLIAQKWLPMWWDALLADKLMDTRDSVAIHKF